MDIEQREPDWFEEAQKRAQRRKSAWNLLLFFLGFVLLPAFGYALFRAVWWIHTAFYPAHQLKDFWGAGISAPSFVCSFLMAFATLPLAIGLAFTCANLIAWTIPPAGKTFEMESDGFPETSFRNSMRGLLKFTAYSLAGLAIALLAAYFLKSLK